MKIKLRTLLIIIIVIAFIVILHFYNKDKDYEIRTDGATVFSYDISAENPHGVISSEDFVYVNDIGIKIEQLKVSELNLDLTIQFDMNQVSGSSIGYSYCVFDENSNIYVYRNGGHAINGMLAYIRKRNMQRDRKWENHREGHAKYHNLKTVSSENGYVTTNIHSLAYFLFGTNNYAKVKHRMGKTLYVELWNANGDKNFDVIFEYHLPDNFYDDTVLNYKLAKNQDKGIKLIYAGCDEYSLTLSISIPNIYDEIGEIHDQASEEQNWSLLYDDIILTDESGNRYERTGAGGSIPDIMKESFKVNKNNPPKELLLHILTRDEPIRLVPIK